MKNKIVCFFFVLSLALFPCLAFADGTTSSAIDTRDLLIDNSLSLTDVNTSLRSVSASDANGFKSVILGLLGDYEADVTDYTYTSSSGYTTHSIEVTPDYAWLGSCAIFVIVIYCLFRIVGGILCRP